MMFCIIGDSYCNLAAVNLGASKFSIENVKCLITKP
uniref:Uncharacterized protein n=1 Tax=Arundo donax TaxID=35708 RepID=A0A0A9B8A9_ARUDO